MRLSRKEILGELKRLGVRTIKDLKRQCREFEAYWHQLQS